jgi:hypothetical protein
MTALGAIRLGRSHGYCYACGQPEFAADRLLGLDDWLTPRARRMASLAGIQDPFRRAEHLLRELSGWSVDAETIRRRCHATAADARQGRAEREHLPEQFGQAAGDRELHIDAGKVNTADGWRDVKVAVFACRERAASASASDYEQRTLPAPNCRAVVAEVEEAQAFGRRCHAEAERLGVTATASLSVLGDGAQWIWNLATEQFGGAAQVLDVYHGVEHLASAARYAFGGGQHLDQWLEDARRRLIGDGYWGVCEMLTQPLPEEEVRRRMDEMAAATLNYFCGHQGRLGYAVRLHRGQAIGSGLVEGTIKQRVNVRMKRSGARWQPDQVGPFVELMAMADSPEWSEFWATMAA